MRILFFIIDLNSGGAEWQLSRLAIALKKDGIKVKVVCMNGAGDVYDYLNQEDIDVICLGYEKLYQLWKLAKFATIIREFKPDILHSWMFHANIIGKIIGKLCGVRNVIASLRVAEKERPYHVWLERISLFLNVNILCNSNGLAKFAESKNIPKEKIKVIPNSFDLSMFSFKQRYIPSDGIWRFLFLGRVSKQKGLTYLIDSLAEIKKEGVKFKVDIVGEAEEELQTFLNQKIIKLQLENSITFKPSVTHNEIPSLMESFHLLILPSLWEGMPNVVMEAFASGLAVVATDIEGTNELIEDGRTGLLSKPSDLNSMTDKILFALRNYDQCKKMATNASDELQEKYTPELIYRKYLDFYKKVLINL